MQKRVVAVGVDNQDKPRVMRLECGPMDVVLVVGNEDGEEELRLFFTQDQMVDMLRSSLEHLDRCYAWRAGCARFTPHKRKS